MMCMRNMQFATVKPKFSMVRASKYGLWLSVNFLVCYGLFQFICSGVDWWCGFSFFLFFFLKFYWYNALHPHPPTPLVL